MKWIRSNNKILSFHHILAEVPLSLPAQKRECAIFRMLYLSQIQVQVVNVCKLVFYVLYGDNINPVKLHTNCSLTPTFFAT